MRAPAWLAATTAATGSAACRRLPHPRISPRMLVSFPLVGFVSLVSSPFLPRSLLFTLRSVAERVHGRSVSTEPHRGHVSTERTRANTQTGCGRRQARRLRINRSRPSATDSFANTPRHCLIFLLRPVEQDKERPNQTGSELERDGRRKENGKTSVAEAWGGVQRFCALHKKFIAGDKQNYHRIVTSTARHVFISLGGSCTTASVVCEAKGDRVVEERARKVERGEIVRSAILYICMYISHPAFREA